VADHFDALWIATATAGEAEAVACVRNAAAEHLTRGFGPGHWSGIVTPHGALRGIESSRVLVARDERRVVGTLRLATRKPWAIDLSYFAPAERPLYLVDMAVLPDAQRRGVGRRLIEAAIRNAAAADADAIRLDAYDHPAGAGVFYEKCGFTVAGRAAYRAVPLVYYQLSLERSTP
jgi:GNAT superfamily N-acetyltransferase